MKTFIVSLILASLAFGFVVWNSVCISAKLDNLLELAEALPADADAFDENDPATKEQMEALLKEIDPRIRFHDFRYVPGPTHTNLIFDVVVPMRFHIEDEELKEQIQQRVREKIGPSYYTVITVDKDYLNQEG